LWNTSTTSTAAGKPFIPLRTQYPVLRQLARRQSAATTVIRSASIIKELVRIMAGLGSGCKNKTKRMNIPIPPHHSVKTNAELASLRELLKQSAARDQVRHDELLKESRKTDRITIIGVIFAAIAAVTGLVPAYLAIFQPSQAPAPVPQVHSDVQTSPAVPDVPPMTTENSPEKPPQPPQKEKH
jgi:hypothetical protein